MQVRQHKIVILPRLPQCPRCGRGHNHLRFLRFSRPPHGATHWAACPANAGQPILGQLDPVLGIVPAEGASTGDLITRRDFRAILDLIMCSDPSPVDDATKKSIIDWADRVAKHFGFTGWIEAYHCLPAKYPSRPARARQKDTP